MSASRGTTLRQHIDFLQSSRTFEASPVCVGPVELPESPVDKLLGDLDHAGSEELRELIAQAGFWIKMLEGEQVDLKEEISRHKRRHQAAVRQLDAKARELRETEGEKKRLLAELRWLQESRDQAICEGYTLKEDRTRMSSQIKNRTQGLEVELQRTRDEKTSIESQLVHAKVRAADTLQRVDSMSVVIEYYEDQLKALNPNFEPVELETMGQFVKPLAGRSADREAVVASTSEERPPNSLAKGFQKMLKGGTSKFFKKRAARDAGDVKEAADEATSSGPRLPASSPSGTPLPTPLPTPRNQSFDAGNPAAKLTGKDAAAADSVVTPGGSDHESTMSMNVPSGQDGLSHPVVDGTGSTVSSPSAKAGRRRWENRVGD